MNGNSLEYIASGLGYTRLTLKDLDDKEDKRQLIKDILTRLNTETQHKFGYLFNAFTEQKFGERLTDYRPYVNSVHCDSGGLQVITRGMNITPDMKRQIYETQAKYCDLAMSFDEIPVTTTGAASGRNDTTNRFFNVAEFDDCAKRTGQNLFEQIQAFEAYKTTAKPLLIAQGNCLETYQKWVEHVLAEIPQEYHHQIGGVAMGAAALGTGSLEDITRAFTFAHLPIDVNHLHILGVGSAVRLVPTLIMIKNGVYKDLKVSYDSTTHTSGMVFGRYYDSNGWMTFPNKHEDKIIHPILYEKIVKQFNLDLSYENMLQVLKNSNSSYAEKTGNCRSDVVLFMTAFAASAIMNFMKQIDTFTDSKQALLEFIGQYENRAIFETLYKVKSVEDFKYWERHVGKYVTSSRISKHQASTLDSFFE